MFPTIEGECRSARLLAVRMQLQIRSTGGERSSMIRRMVRAHRHTERCSQGTHTPRWRTAEFGPHREPRARRDRSARYRNRRS